MTIKRLNEVMRNPKLYAQTKALYSYLYVRADHKTNMAYPPKEQILKELNITESLYIQGLKVLENQGYIKTDTKQAKEDKHTYTIYQLLDKE